MADLLTDEDMGIRPAGKPALLSDADMGIKSATPPRPVGAAMGVQQRVPQESQVAPPEDASRAALEDPTAALPNGRADTSQRPIAPVSPSQPSQGRSWGGTLGEAVTNIPASAVNFAKSVIEPILHPVDTAKSLVALGDAVGSKISRPGNLRRPGDPEPTPAQLEDRAKREAPADAVGEFFSGRYGSLEGFKEALATDPIGVVADISTVLTGGSMLPTRAGPALARVGAAIDPLTQTGAALKLAGRAIEKPVSEALGMTTGAGAESIRTAGRAGMEGGETAKAFTENMRGSVPVENIVELAKSALDKMRQERGAEYRSGMVDISKDRTILDFGDINKAISSAGEVGSFKGANIAPAAGDINAQLRTIVKDWEDLNPQSPIFKDVPPGELTAANFHTPEGLDALKRTIGNVRDSTDFGTPSRVAADRVYNAVKNEIIAQAPAYGKLMEDYEIASDRLKEVSKTFSLGEKATGETASRKLQSATRDGAQTSWRNRGELLEELSAHEPTLPAAIAGQSTNALPPRGLVGRGGLMATATGALANPIGAAAGALAFSPRIVGETVYIGGKAVGGLKEIAKAFGTTPERMRLAAMGAFQAGRAEQVSAGDVAERIMGASTLSEAIGEAEKATR